MGLVNFFLHPRFRVCFSLLFVCSWFAFLFATSHSRDSYLQRALPEIFRGDTIWWRNDAGKLLFKGWSDAEAEYRWSRERRVGFCFRLNRASFEQSNPAGVLDLALQMEPIPEWVGREIRFSLSPGGQTGKTKLVSGRSSYGIHARYESFPDVACLNIDLPPAGSGMFNDFHGMKFYSATFQ